jgi:hypothetical protein
VMTSMPASRKPMTSFCASSCSIGSSSYAAAS